MPALICLENNTQRDEKKQVTACIRKLTAAWSDEGELRSHTICLLKRDGDEINLKGLQPVYDVSSAIITPNPTFLKITHFCDVKVWFEHACTQDKQAVCYKLKTCILQTINSAYKGIFVFSTDKVSVYTVDMKHHQLNQWDSDTARGCDYWYWSGTGRLGHMHISPMWHQKGRRSKESVYKKKSLLVYGEHMTLILPAPRTRWSEG